MKNRKRSAVDIALIRLNHLPFVVTNNRKMAVWSDLKEIMLWCPSPQCCVVLDALKLILGYPAYERAMHPCSQLEQLMFLKHFMFVTHGTLLVDIDSLRDGARLALLYNMVKEKHTKPNNQTVFNCTKMLKTFTEKYANTSFKIPLSSASGKMLLPAVRRISKSAARGEIHIPNNDQDSGRGHSRSHDFSRRLDNDGDDGILEPNRPEPFAQTKLGGSTSRTLLPLALLCKLYPGCEGFLEEVVRLYILGQCGEEYLQSVCQCTTEEGIQLTRFLASQNGYDTFWLCLTTCSLMMSWSEFWLGYDRMWGGKLEVMSGDVCVVTLNCQTTDVGQNDKAITNKQKNAAPRKQTVPTQPSPSLSTINDITENVQSQNLSGPLAILSEESLEDTAYCKCDQNCQAHIKTVVDEIESTVESSNLDSELVTTKSDEGNEDNEKQRELEKKVIKCSGKKSKKKSSGTEKIKTLSRGRNKEIDVPKADDKTVSELNSCEKTKPHKARRKNKKPKAVDRDATEQDTGSRGIKSRLRSRNPARKITKEKSVISKRDANNSAITNAIASSLQRSGSSDSNKSGSKSDEMTEYFHPIAEQVAEVNKPSSRISQCIPLKTELPISEVSPYDLASMKYSQMAGIHVSVTPKKAQGIHRENVPFFEKPNIAKKKVENLQSIRNRRESLKISSAEIQDELPVSFKYTSNAPAVKLSSSPTAEQACSVTRKRGKWYNKFGADPKKIQKSKTIPHKLIKSTEDTARRNRTEALIHRPRTDPFSVVLEGKPYQQTTTIYSYELGQSSADKQRDSFGSPAVESCTHSFSTNKTGPLHEKIVNNLQKQAFSSFRSVSGNQDEKGNLAAEGKAMKQYDKLKDLNSSEFLEQRVKKWKNEVEQSLNIAGRLSKSADLVKRRNMGTYRPRSCGCRPNSTPLDGRVQSFKTSLCSLFSRDCASPNMFDKQVCCQASANETIERQDSENFANECSNKYSSPSPLTADNDKIVHAGTGNGQFKLDYQYEVQNYGSSSSLTPDIYDEFARKKNPKSLRPDIVKIKPKPVTIPSPFTLSQPVVRKQPQPSLQVSKKANFHTVGYMSSAEQSQQQREDSSSTFNEDIKQMYHYSQTKLTNCPSQQKGLTSNNPHTFCQGNDILTTDPSENKHLHSDKELLVPKNCHPAGEKHVEKFLPHTFVSSTSVNSVGNQQTALYVNHDPAKVETFPFLSQTYRFDNSTHVGCLQGHEKTDNYKDKQEAENTLCGMMYDSADGKNSNISALNKLSNFRHFEITPGKLESLDYISSIQALLPNTNVISALPEKDCTHLESTNCTRKCLSEVTTTTTKNGKYALLGSSHQTGLNCQRSKSELKYEENKLLDPRPREHTLSKVNTQLYYKVPGEDIVHPVSENVIIPKYAQFFVQATATENDVCVKEKKIILDKDNILEKDTIVVTTNGKEAVGSEPRKETDTSEYRGNKPAKSNSSEEERLSSTTFDNIIKASEDFIDKSRLIKHVISKTKQAIENTKAEEDVASPGNQIKVSDIKTNIGEQIEEREGDEYQKVIIPSSGQVTEKQSTSQKKSFKDIIEEKREEKRKLQLHLSRKKYWNSAHAKKDGNTGNLSIDNRSNKQKNEGQLDKSRVKAAPKQNNECFKHETNIDKQNRKGKCERQINSKFVIASPRRPKTCIGFGKGRTAMNVSNAGIKMKKDPPALSARSHTDFAMNKKFDKVGPFDRSKYQQHTKPATIFARAKNSKSQPPKEADDCTSKILTALRRLSIEKSPKITEQKASLKQEMRQNKLSACVSKQTKLVKVSHTDKEKDKKSNNTVLMKDSNDLHEVHNDENIQEEVKHIGMEENTEVSKISVVIGMRKVCNDEVPESHENSVEDLKDEECVAANYQDLYLQRQSDHAIEQIGHEISGYGNNMQTNKSVSGSYQEAVPNKETFITLYDTRKLAMYRSGPASINSTSNSNVDVSQMNEEKYLGLPYFQDANSNMNNLEYKVPVVNVETENCLRSDSALLKENTEQIAEMTNEQLYSMKFFPPKNAGVNNKDLVCEIPTVSTVEIQSGENQGQQNFNLVDNLSWKAESNITVTQHLSADNILLGDQALFQDRSYPQQGILGSENVEQLTDNGLDPNLLHKMYSKNIVGNPEEGYYFAQTDAEHVNHDAFIMEEEGQRQGQCHEKFTYVAYAIPHVMDKHSDDSVNVINKIKQNEVNIENERDNLMKYQNKAGDIENTCETDPYLFDHPTGADEDLENIYFFQPILPGSLMQQTGVELVVNDDSDRDIKQSSEEVNRHAQGLVYEEPDHCFQVENLADQCWEEGQTVERLYMERNCLNILNNGEYFLDETDCGQEVCIGDNETDGRNIQDFENGQCKLPENEVSGNIFSRSKSSSELSDNINAKDTKDRGIDVSENRNGVLKDSGKEMKPEEQTGRKELMISINRDSCNIVQTEGKKSSYTAKKKKKIKSKPKKEKTNTSVQSAHGKSEHITVEEKYSPSKSEVEAYFKEISKRTGIEDATKSKYKTEDKKMDTINYDSETGSESADSLPEFSLDFSIKTASLNKSESDKASEINRITDDNKGIARGKLRLDDDDENDGDIDDDDDYDDDDYNPEDDLNESEEYSDYSGSDEETLEKETNDNIDKTVKSCLKEKKVKKGKLNFVSRKSNGVSLEKVRKSFQKKYEVKNSSAIHEWKQRSQKEDRKNGQNLGSKLSTSKNSKEREKSVVREFCLKQSQQNNDIPDKKESDMNAYFGNFMKSHSHKILIGKNNPPNTDDITSSTYNETVDASVSKSMDMKEETGDSHEIKQLDSKTVQKKRKKKKGKKIINVEMQDEDENSENEKRKQKEENLAAEGFIKTQKRYYEILRNSTIGTGREDNEVCNEQSVEEPVVDELSEVIGAVPVHGERVITKALSDAEKALEGTGTLKDIHNEDEGTMVEDLINQCSYQMIEDEDHVQLGGVAHFKDFTLPFVYINGYKYTPLKDALTLFSPECCISACTIPRSVLQKHKAIVKTFSTWEQVYKLELIKMKKGPAIMTGDMLLKLDTLLTLLPELIQQIVELHIGTKLKRSKTCDINAYKILKSTFM